MINGRWPFFFCPWPCSTLQLVTATPRPTPPLPCPECRTGGVEGGARIGNRRSVCTTCNNFAQAVMRLTLRRLKERFPDAFEELRVRTELDLYPGEMDKWFEAGKVAQ